VAASGEDKGEMTSESEDQAQRALVKHLEARGVPGLVFLAIPNGEYRDPRTAARLKAQGVRPGAPDLFLSRPAAPGEPFKPSLWLELKAAKGRLSFEQKTMHAALEKCGEAVQVAYGLDGALEVCENWGFIYPSKTQTFQ
jgi:hypothetical protein